MEAELRERLKAEILASMQAEKIAAETLAAETTNVATEEIPVKEVFAEEATITPAEGIVEDISEDMSGDETAAGESVQA